MKAIKPVLSLLLAAVIMGGLGIPAFAAETNPNGKEEVVYGMLNTDGSVKGVYVVNLFHGGTITDYGDYTSVKILNTTDSIDYSNEKVTINTTADKVYYQGHLQSAKLPWEISIRYFLDGKEYPADALAGQSGALEIKLSIKKNPLDNSKFYDNFALQTTLTLDTNKCANITAENATAVNVGTDKQLLYTVLPGEGIEAAIKADVTDFEMAGIAINGIKLALDIKIDDSELLAKVNELVEAVDKTNSGAKDLENGAADLNDAANGEFSNGIGDLTDGIGDLDAGAGTLKDGGGSLKDGAAALQTGAASLDKGVAELQAGIALAEDGIALLNNNSAGLTSGSAEMKAALTAIQQALGAVAVNSEKLSDLTTASAAIKSGIDNLAYGTAQLEASIGYAQYKALMAGNGLDIDSLLAEDSNAVSNLSMQAAALSETLTQIQGMPEYEQLASQLQSQISLLQQIAVLLEGNRAAIGGAEGYLNELAWAASQLRGGADALQTSYAGFDLAIGELVTHLSSMLPSLNSLSAGIDTLVTQYEAFDSGLTAYTEGVASLAAGYGQIMDGVANLATGSKELKAGSGSLYSGASDLYDGIVALSNGAGTLHSGASDLQSGTNTLIDGILALYNGTKDLSGGTAEFQEKTAGMDTQINEQIDEMLATLTGGDSEIQSFVSDKNNAVKSVQFVLKTDPIELDDLPQASIKQDEEPTVWQKLLRLFGWE